MVNQRTVRGVCTHGERLAASRKTDSPCQYTRVVGTLCNMHRKIPVSAVRVVLSVRCD